MQIPLRRSFYIAFQGQVFFHLSSHFQVGNTEARMHRADPGIKPDGVTLASRSLDPFIFSYGNTVAKVRSY